MSHLAGRKNVKWKWNKRFEKAALKKCILTEEGMINNCLVNPSLLQIFTEMIGLEGLFKLIKIEQNGRVFKKNKKS